MDTPTAATPSTTVTVQMPIGYRFCPTDEEIIVHYLRPKVFSFPLPATAIHHYNNHFNQHPSCLPGDPKEKRYFFCKTSDINHATNVSGYWMPNIKNNNVNAHELILATGCNHPIGFKKSFVFYEFKDQRRSGSKTSWILHQYRVLYPLPIKMEEWVVCSIHMKSKKVKKNKQQEGSSKRVKRCHNKNDISHVVTDDDSTSSASSGITFNNLDDRKDEEEEDEEESKVN